MNIIPGNLVYLNARYASAVGIVLALPAPAHAACISITSPATWSFDTQGTSALVAFSDTPYKIAGSECLGNRLWQSHLGHTQSAAIYPGTLQPSLGNHRPVRSWTQSGGSLLGSVSITGA